MPTPGSRPQRGRDTGHRLTHDIDDRFVARLRPHAPATPYRWFRICPHRIESWREVNELPDGELMRDDRWWSDASAGRAAWPV